MEVIKWFVVYNFRKCEYICGNLNLNRISLKDLQHG